MPLNNSFYLIINFAYKWDLSCEGKIENFDCQLKECPKCPASECQVSEDKIINHN